MFAVVDTPCSPKEYNGLPGIMEADGAIKSVRARLDQLVAFGSEACRSTLFPHGEIGAFLLHKHWQVEEQHCMIEHSASHPTGRPALITSAQRFSGHSTVAPSRFRIDPVRQELVALEFSSDQFVAEVWRALRAHPTLVENICGLIADSGLADQIGFATFARATIPVAEGEEIVEENWDRKSVLSAQVLVRDEQTAVVPTGWAFIPTGKVEAASCIGYCMLFAGLHCVHHYNRPMLKAAPPPLCTLHD